MPYCRCRWCAVVVAAGWLVCIIKRRCGVGERERERERGRERDKWSDERGAARVNIGQG